MRKVMLFLGLFACVGLWASVHFDQLSDIALQGGTFLKTEVRTVQGQQSIVSYSHSGNQVTMLVNSLEGVPIDTLTVTSTLVGELQAAIYFEKGGFRCLAVGSRVNRTESTVLSWGVIDVVTGQPLQAGEFDHWTSSSDYDPDTGESESTTYRVEITDVNAINANGETVSILFSVRCIHTHQWSAGDGMASNDDGFYESRLYRLTLNIYNGALYFNNSSQHRVGAIFSSSYGGEYPLLSSGYDDACYSSEGCYFNGSLHEYLSRSVSGGWHVIEEQSGSWAGDNTLAEYYPLSKDNPAGFGSMTYCQLDYSVQTPCPLYITERDLAGNLLWTQSTNFLDSNCWDFSGSSIRSADSLECVLVIAHLAFQLRDRTDGAIIDSGSGPFTPNYWYSHTLGSARLADGSIMFWLRSGSVLQRWHCTLDAVATSDTSAPTPALTLAQNAPNPFNPVTRIDYSLAAPGTVKLAVYDLRGRLVRTLANEEEGPGAHNIEWNGTDDSGRPVASGVYLYRLDAAGSSLTRKCLMMK
jgi:hypothetical protein